MAGYKKEYIQKALELYDEKSQAEKGKDVEEIIQEVVDALPSVHKGWTQYPKADQITKWLGKRSEKVAKEIEALEEATTLTLVEEKESEVVEIASDSEPTGPARPEKPPTATEEQKGQVQEDQIQETQDDQETQDEEVSEELDETIPLSDAEKQIMEFLKTPKGQVSSHTLVEAIRRLKGFLKETKAAVDERNKAMSELKEVAKEEKNQKVADVIKDIEAAAQKRIDEIDAWNPQLNVYEDDNKENREDLKRYAEKLKERQRREVTKKIEAFKRRLQRKYGKDDVFVGKGTGKIAEIESTVAEFMKELNGEFALRQIGNQKLFELVMRRYEPALSEADEENKLAQGDLEEWVDGHPLRQMIASHTANGMNKITQLQRKNLSKKAWKEFNVQSKKDEDYTLVELPEDTNRTMIEQMREEIHHITGKVPDRFNKWDFEQLEPQDDIIVRVEDKIARGIQNAKDLPGNIGRKATEIGGRIKESTKTLPTDIKNKTNEVKDQFKPIHDAIDSKVTKIIETYKSRQKNQTELAFESVGNDQLSTQEDTRPVGENQALFGANQELPELSEEELEGTEVDEQTVVDLAETHRNHFFQDIRDKIGNFLSGLKNKIVKPKEQTPEQEQERDK